MKHSYAVKKDEKKPSKGVSVYKTHVVYVVIDEIWKKYVAGFFKFLLWFMKLV